MSVVPPESGSIMAALRVLEYAVAEYAPLFRLTCQFQNKDTRYALNRARKLFRGDTGLW